MIRALFRVLAGLLFASLVAGLVTVAFVITPAELATSGPEFSARLASFGMLALLAATHSAIFAAPFGLIAAVIGEWQSLRSPMYYVTVGVLIAMAGFAAQYSSETGAAATIANNYAFKAFLTAGFCGGLGYWMLSGRSAGDDPIDDVPASGQPKGLVGTSGGSVPAVGAAPSKSQGPDPNASAASASKPSIAASSTARSA